MDELRIAFLGTGVIASKCLPHALAAPGVHVSHIASRSVERAQGFIDEHQLSNCRACTYQDVLSDGSIDAAYITLPNHMHVAWSLAFLKAGKHVLCEKPATPYRDELDQVLSLARSQKLVWQEAFMYPHHPQSKELRRLTLLARDEPEKSVIGKLRMIKAEAISNLGDGPHVQHRLRRSTQGGGLQDCGVYPLGIALWLTGEQAIPKTMKANAQPARTPDGEEKPVDGSMCWNFMLPSGVMVQGACAIDVHRSHGLWIFGENGTISTSFPYAPDATRSVISVRTRGQAHDDTSKDIVINNPGDRIEHQFAHFAQACLNSEPIIPSWDYSQNLATAIEMLYAHVDMPLPRSEIDTSAF